MLVGERRNGNLLVQLDPKLQAQPVELLRQRLSPDGHTEYLIRWALQNVEEVAGSSGTTSQTESKSPNILMWMSAEEVYTNCPTLLGKRKPEGPGIAEEKTSGSPDEGALQEMTEDVRMLVQRASRQMSQSLGPDSSILNTIHVLSAYASIGSLAGVFKETGALDLLMKMLCNSEKQIRKNAGKMLRALASHDAGSRAHVLLSLSQQDGIEQHMDFESRYTLLQLFAETTSSEEHCISFEGIHLPQIPGKQLFSLVKRYLCVTSLLDQLSSDRPDRTEMSRLQRHFDFSMAMGSLICELVRVMGWVNEDSLAKGSSLHTDQSSRVVRSIFQPKVPSCSSFEVISCSPIHVAASKRKPTKTFLEPSDFATRNAYVDYVQEALKPGMSVRMLEDYDEISAGDEGVFRQSNNGMPPVQVLWRSTGRTYWVHWHMIQITGEQLEENGTEKASTVADNVKVSPVAQSLLCKPFSSIYSLPYLGPAAFQERGMLRQDEWWEVLFFIRRLEVPEQNEVHTMIKHNLEEYNIPSMALSCDHLAHLLSFFLGSGTFWGSSPRVCLELLAEMLDKVKRNVCGAGALGFIVQIMEHQLGEEVHGVKVEGRTSCRDKIVKLLVELLTSQVKDKLLVLTCLELTYLVMSRYDWHVTLCPMYGTCVTLCPMYGTCVTLCPMYGTCMTLCPMYGTCMTLCPMYGTCVALCPMYATCVALWPMYGTCMTFWPMYGTCVAFWPMYGTCVALWPMYGTCVALWPMYGTCMTPSLSSGRCLSSVYNGFLVIRMLMENHKGLSEQLSSLELSSVLQNFSEDSTNSIYGRLDLLMQKQLSELLKNNKEKCSADGKGEKVIDRGLAGGLHYWDHHLLGVESHSKKNAVGSVGSFSDFLQWAYHKIYISRILNKSLDFYQEDTLPWHKSIEPCLTSLGSTSSDQEILQEVVSFLHRLASTNKDCAVVMCRLGAKDMLNKVLEKHSSGLLQAPELRDLLSDCEKYSSLYQKMATSILAGCIQMVLTQIEEHRRTQQQVNIPFFDVFLRNLCQGSSVEVKEDKCWEKIEVSSNPHRANKLTDGNPKSYWESSGSTGSHYINISMHRGVVIREMEESFEPQEFAADDFEVQISVLSPRCWSISSLCYLTDPSRKFPESLSNPLLHFTDFYVKSQYVPGASHIQSRQLQWTWLGNAEVQYGGLLLRVSTLQGGGGGGGGVMGVMKCSMFEEVLEESIIKATGLPETLVSHALAPLTAKGSILVHKKKGLLSLNEEKLIEQSSGKIMQLLPKQTYLNIEEDEGRTLEKKRNIILCLIIQIMKEEKELHIDNLVFRVIDSCQKLEVGKSLKFLSFSCSHTDVLSGIMYLVSQGYARRSEDNPHILEYLSKDPSTPHKSKAHITFQTGSKKKPERGGNASSSGGVVEQTVLESVLLPMGRTLGQEEVRVLMVSMVNQVSETLSVTEDSAQHLLIHCKWNMDLLLQKYTDDPEVLLIASGLQVQEPYHSESPQPICPVCMSPISPEDIPPSLCCGHSCCKNCWNEYLTTRIEQNLVLNCTCPTTDCLAQPTSDFIHKIISSKEVIQKYEKSLLRGFVESCSNLTWCTNPQGCDRILCKEGLGTGAACAKCSWVSCFNCSFPEAHYPASCSHMSQWMDDGGFYEGMTVEAQSKHLTKLISKHCPSCQAPIEKNEGCLHMTCAKCNHGFCWRCLKPWKPTHKDYYNCTAMVSKAARQEKRFQDYNERCTFQHQAKEFAISLRNRLCVLSEEPPLRNLTLLISACKVLEMSRKVLGYACVYSYYNQDLERLDVLESQTENLESHVNALQILLEYSLLQSEDLACSVRLLSSERYNSALELVRRVQERLTGILHHSTQDFRVGFLSQPDDNPRKSSNVPEVAAFHGASDTIDGASDSGDLAGEQEDEDDDEYVPEWHEDYDDDLDEDDFSYDEDDESENLEPDSFIFEDYDGEAYE
ncbi:LOW QUALITY PROTEIN: cullin-9 [Pyxicephalus adspersus]|uniref:LOW QUALITY PROTEIN: cullin-9 n=1 Tax=Pyxicephalus adspersus TaxID=30357 RepID=UPI003B5CC2B3